MNKLDGTRRAYVDDYAAACRDLDLWPLIPKANQHIYEPKYICDQNWVKFPSLVFTVRLHVMQRTYCCRNSVWLTGACIVTNEILVCQYLEHQTKKGYISRPSTRTGVAGNCPFYPKYSPKLIYPLEKRRLPQISAYNISTVRGSENVFFRIKVNFNRTKSATKFLFLWKLSAPK